MSSDVSTSGYRKSGGLWTVDPNGDHGQDPWF